ncbi:MAG: GNAT family N-acetyltransferase, partial [bacterium]|nr:GNAT family N-acetyltransferase [bacterium]
MNLQLRKATVADSRFLFELRNDASVREVSFSTTPIPFEAHEKWLAKKLADTSASLFIAETIEGEPVAQVRFDATETNSAEVSIAVEKTHRGKGYGSLALSRASRRFLAEHPALTRIRARIKADNLASLHSFKKAGYKQIEEKETHGGVAVTLLEFP